MSIFTWWKFLMFRIVLRTCLVWLLELLIQIIKMTWGFFPPCKNSEVRIARNCETRRCLGLLWSLKMSLKTRTQWIKEQVSVTYSYAQSENAPMTGQGRSQGLNRMAMPVERISNKTQMKSLSWWKEEFMTMAFIIKSHLLLHFHSFILLA